MIKTLLDQINETHKNFFYRYEYENNETKERTLVEAGGEAALIDFEPRLLKTHIDAMNTNIEKKINTKNNYSKKEEFEIDSNLMLRPHQILVELLDKSFKKEIKNHVEIINNFMKFTTEIYTNKFSQAKKTLQEITKEIETKKPYIINKISTHYRHDEVSVFHYHPTLNKINAQKLATKLHNKPILTIPIAFGGITPGIDFHIKYTHQTNTQKDSHIYPIKFSERKKRERMPYISKREQDYLKTFKNKEIVIIDSDIETGTTINIVERCLEIILGYNKKRHKIKTKLTKKGGKIHKISNTRKSYHPRIK